MDESDRREIGHDSIPADTSPEALRLQVLLWRRMSPAETVTIVGGISVAVRELALAGVRMRHPHASDRECALRLAIITLGPELACKVYPDASSLVGPHS